MDPYFKNRDDLSIEEVAHSASHVSMSVVFCAHTDEQIHRDIAQFVAAFARFGSAAARYLYLVLWSETLGDGHFVAMGTIGKQLRARDPFEVFVDEIEMDPKGYGYAATAMNMEGFAFDPECWAALVTRTSRNVWLVCFDNKLPSDSLRRLAAVSRVNDPRENEAIAQSPMWLEADRFGQSFRCYVPNERLEQFKAQVLGAINQNG